jgi:hypothetical protein
MNAKKTVTPTYTTALFVIWFVSKFTVSLLSYKNEPDMLIDVLFDYDFLMGMGLMLVLFVMGAIVSVWVVRSFWERFVSGMLNVRQITIHEALSAVLVIMILTLN